jgi:hypothetical protein
VRSQRRDIDAAGEQVKVLATKEGATILSGAALAAVLGIMLGGSMRPQLIFGDRPMGPQMFAGGGGPRSTGPFDMRDAYATYGANLPTYVTGTDYVQAAYVEEPETAEQPPVDEPVEAGTPTAATFAQVRYEDVRAPVVVYPSESGGMSYQADAPAQPPSRDDELPVVTG